MAKKIINGRMYNTDTTEVLGSWDNGYPRGDFSFEEQTLHKKKTGEYFVYASGGAQSNFGDCYGGHDCSGEKFIPMSVEQAQQWSEEYLTVEKYVEMNVAHPFREGNGRSMRLWLDHMLCTELQKTIDWSQVDKEQYLSAMERSPVNDLEIKAILAKALTSDINNRELFMKGLDHSYYFEGYQLFKSEDL